MANIVLLIQRVASPSKNQGLKAQVSRLHSEGEGHGPSTWIPLNEINLERPEPMIGFEASLRWYIEEYSLHEPFEDARAKRIEKAIEEYGLALQAQLRLPELAATLPSSTEGGVKGDGPSSMSVELYVLEDATDDEWGCIHWESLESLAAALKCPSLSVQVSRISTPSPRADALQVMLSASQDILHVLVVVSRPDKEADIPYRKVSLPVTNATEEFPRHVITADVVGVGTWKALEEALEEKPVGYYGIVHFDVHGAIEKHRAYLRFRRSPKFVFADTIAETLVKHGVQAMILNACGSARKPRPTQESLALALLNRGMLFVIGMAYDVHEDAVFHFVRGLYGSLLDGQATVLEAVSLGRRNMQLNPQRVGKFALAVDVQDWLNPVLYCRDPTPVRLMAPSQPRIQKPSCSLPASWTAGWPQGFFGRDWDIAKIEWALRINKLARIEGFRGAGKSTLTKHLAEWWKRSNFAEAVFMVDFSFTADGFDSNSLKAYPTEIFAKIDSILANRDRISPDRCRFYELSPSQTLDPSALHLPGNLNGHEDAMNLAQAIAHLNLDDEKTTGYGKPEDPGLLLRLKSEFASTRYVIIINALHNVTSPMCGGSGTFFSWIEDMKRWLEHLGLQSWKSAALFSSMLTEGWLDGLGSQIVALGGLDPLYATQYAQYVVDLGRYSKDTLQRDCLSRIMEYFEYQPLALRLVLRKFVASGLPPATYFERLLCGITELKLNTDIPDERQLLLDFTVAVMALPTWIPGLDAVQLYCPRAFILQQLEGKGTFDAEENPLERWNDTLETLQDFGIARKISARDNRDVLATGDLKLHPLFSAHLRWCSRKMHTPKGVKPVDITFSFLVYYLERRSCAWDNNGELEGLTDEGHKDMERNWFNILAALQYCVLRPYLWNYQLERAFDFIMKRVTYYATFYKPREKNFVARIERSAIGRIAVAFSGSKATALTPWWAHARLAATKQEEDSQVPSGKIKSTVQKVKRICGRRNHSVMPWWLFRRVVVTYLSLRVDAWKSFNPIGWEYNNMLMGLLAWRRPQLGQVPEELRPPKEELFYCFLEQEANICIAEIAYQTSDHRLEGLKALERVDLSKVPEEMRETLEVRARDIRAELMDFIMDAENYQGDSATMAIIKKAEETGVLPKEERAARAIVTRRAYEAACTSKDEADFSRAKMFIYQDLDMVENPADPYPLVLHRFLFDLFVLENGWESALKQLQLIEKFVESNPERYHSILHQDGPYSYLLQLHSDFEKCYKNLGDPKQARIHHEEYKKLLQKRKTMMATKKERQRRGLENMLAAIEYAIQTSGTTGPQGYKNQTFERGVPSYSSSGGEEC